MRYDRHLAEEKNVFIPLQTPVCSTPLSNLLLSKQSGDLHNYKLRKICKMTEILSGPFSQNDSHNA